MDDIKNRKGAPAPQKVPKNVHQLISSGEIPAVNLGETLSIDNLLLFESVLDSYGIKADISPLKSDAENTKMMTCYRNIGMFINQSLNDDEIKILSTHVSDIVRCWACLSAGYKSVDFVTRMRLIEPYADDIHMGVREMAWMALRADIDADPEFAVDSLMPWTESESANIRRCASEATRPRGVWCKHIQFFKDNPEAGLKLLEPLKSDSSKYVRDSVANWLNDASKSKPEWVVSVTDRWIKESPTKETEKICKRALRTINKKG